MAITTDNYVAYDSDLHYYYLTEQGVVHYTGKKHIPNVWDNAEWRLKNMAELLHTDYTFNVHNHRKERYRPKDLVEYNIFKNEKNERDAIIRALTLFAIVADDYDMDLDIMAGEKEIPESVKKPLRQAGIYFRGDYSGYIDEDEFRDGY